MTKTKSDKKIIVPPVLFKLHNSVVYHKIYILFKKKVRRLLKGWTKNRRIKRYSHTRFNSRHSLKSFNSFRCGKTKNGNFYP